MENFDGKSNDLIFAVATTALLAILCGVIGKMKATELCFMVISSYVHRKQGSKTVCGYVAFTFTLGHKYKLVCHSVIVTLAATLFSPGRSSSPA